MSNALSTTPHVRIETPEAVLRGDLAMPAGAGGIILFAHGSGSSRQSPRNRYVAEVLRDRGFGTLLMDLLTEEEERQDLRTRAWRFDVGLLARRLTHVMEWVIRHSNPPPPIGLFGASTGAAAALIAAAQQPAHVHAIVSRGGRPDLADAALGRVTAPVLLIVGGRDEAVIELNRHALEELKSAKAMEIVGGAAHLFEEPGALEQVARLAASWFTRFVGHASM